jgi:hypothetical protein
MLEVLFGHRRQIDVEQLQVVNWPYAWPAPLPPLHPAGPMPLPPAAAAAAVAAAAADDEGEDKAELPTLEDDAHPGDWEDGELRESLNERLLRERRERMAAHGPSVQILGKRKAASLRAEAANAAPLGSSCIQCGSHIRGHTGCSMSCCSAKCCREQMRSAAAAPEMCRLRAHRDS